jgi:Protein of unknown function (DUF2393)
MLSMGGLIQPSPTTTPSESNWRPIVLGVVMVVVVMGVIAFLTRSAPKSAVAPDPYAASLQLSDLKMSAAENFVGASVTYLDGNLTNNGDKTVTHAVVRLGFKDSLGQIAQTEDIPVRVLQTTGPYPDTVDVSAAPLAPHQSKPFRLTLEHVTDSWNREYPDLKIISVSTK